MVQLTGAVLSLSRFGVRSFETYVCSFVKYSNNFVKYSNKKLNRVSASYS